MLQHNIFTPRNSRHLQTGSHATRGSMGILARYKPIVVVQLGPHWESSCVDMQLTERLCDGPQRH